MIKRQLIPSLLMAFLIFGCTKHMPQAAENKSYSELSSKSGSKVKGFVHFLPSSEGIRVIAEVRGLTPNSVHGFHIHERGDCSAEDASSAGGHFAPGGFPHGSPEADLHHAGDLGNLEADKNGVARIDQVFHGITLNPEMNNSILGLAVVVHEKEDDFTSQPSGNAGARIACGVITQ